MSPEKNNSSNAHSVPQEKLWKHGISTQEWDFVFNLVREHPDKVASHVLSWAQRIALIAIAAGLLIWIAMDHRTSLTIINGVMITFYLLISAYKLYLIHVSLGQPRELHFTPADIAALDDRDLPVYTILVPLYHETESLPRLVEGLGSLDYPKDKLDVILLLEEDDAETVAAARSIAMPPFIRSVVVLDCQPKTKPKACNLGLAMARGEYLVIYDAEDKPDPDQLKKAVLGFRQVPEKVICLQAKLNFYNRRQNLLTRLFTTEYSMWFDLFLPGLSSLRGPIPLGGTSNHFRTKPLRDLMGWDPFNVTEDCDLGLRVALSGYETMMLDTTTWEEACSDAGYWVRQRSRWTKGYIQTFLVATRHPLAMVRRLGILGTLGFFFMVGGTPLCLLINPVYWALTLGWFIFRMESLALLFPFPIILWGLVCLFVGNFVFIYAALIAAYRRGYYDLVKYGLLAPGYWLMMSVGGWKGFLQIIYKPSYWEKTKHGFDIAAGEEPAAVEEPKPSESS